jgi:hypothetical protein
MMLTGQLAIGPFNLVRSGVAVNAKSLVIVSHVKEKANSILIILFAWGRVNYFLGAFSGTLVPSSFLCTLMSLQTSFLVFSSVLQTRLVSPAALATVIKLTAITVAQQILIIAFIFYPLSRQ